MGHKVHPIGFRLGVIRDWEAKWYAEGNYADFLMEDVKIRNAIRDNYREAAISTVDINRQAKDVTITLFTSRPGIVIGRGGQRVDEMRAFLEGYIGKRVRLNIQEVRQPELDAYLVARNIADQIERRIAYRRAMKQSIFRTMQAGAKGIRVSAAGRLGDAEIARRQTMHEGQVPLHTLRADIDYGFAEARTQLGRIGIKAWIYKGEVLPEPKGGEGGEPRAGAILMPAAGTEGAAEEAAPGAVEAGGVSGGSEVTAEIESGPAGEKKAEAPAKPRTKTVRKAAVKETEEQEETDTVPEAEKPEKEADKPAPRTRKKSEEKAETVAAEEAAAEEKEEDAAA